MFMTYVNNHSEKHAYQELFIPSWQPLPLDALHIGAALAFRADLADDDSLSPKAGHVRRLGEL